MAQKLAFAHLSDIHFVRGFSGSSSYDLDDIVRNEILRDASRMRPDLGPVLGILVSGDIAFAGKAEEYEKALDWLERFASALQCEREYLWCVPGNHDVDRSVLKQYTLLEPVHSDIRKAQDRDDRLRHHLESKAGPLIFAPLENYINGFASRFGCLTSPLRPWWEDELELSDGSRVKLRGLNTVMLCGLDDGAQMLMGSAQTEYRREDNVTYVTLFHHPVESLIDLDNSREALCACSQIQLFGHKHAQRIEQVNQSLWICAGAVHPVRAEKQWLPRYNYLSLDVIWEQEQRYLSVDVYPRVWSQVERMFVAEATSSGSGPQNYRLRVANWRGPTMESGQCSSEPPAPLSVQEAPALELSLNRKKLVYGFLNLPYHVRVSIMGSLGLWEESDRQRSDPEVFVSCFERARERKVLDRLWEAVEKHTAAR